MTERICCVCRVRQPVADMIRIARTDGKFSVDKTGKGGGRGCRVCRKCVEKAIRTKALNRSFKCNVGETVYKELSNMLQ